MDPNQAEAHRIRNEARAKAAQKTQIPTKVNDEPKPKKESIASKLTKIVTKKKGKKK